MVGLWVFIQVKGKKETKKEWNEENYIEIIILHTRDYL